jgi:hypothetical protein
MSSTIPSNENFKIVVVKTSEYDDETQYHKLWYYIQEKLVCKAVYDDAWKFVSYYYLDNSYIKECIKNEEEILFHYTYSNPEKDRVVTPISINDNILLGLEDGKHKEFRLDGVLIRSELEDEYELYKSKFD